MLNVAGVRRTHVGARPRGRASTTTGRASTSFWRPAPTARRPARIFTACLRPRTCGWMRKGLTTRLHGLSWRHMRASWWGTSPRRSALATSSQVCRYLPALKLCAGHESRLPNEHTSALHGHLTKTEDSSSVDSTFLSVGLHCSIYLSWMCHLERQIGRCGH